jgi:hypothetical protein
MGSVNARSIHEFNTATVGTDSRRSNFTVADHLTGDGLLPPTLCVVATTSTTVVGFNVTLLSSWLVLYVDRKNSNR